MALALLPLARAAGLRSIAPAVCVVGSQSLWFVVPAITRNFGLSPNVDPLGLNRARYSFLWVALAHAAQYLWITASYAEATERTRSAPAFQLNALAVGSAAWTAPALLFASGVLVAATVNVHHFMLDGVIWKLCDRRVAEPLPRGARALRRVARPRSRPGRGATPVGARAAEARPHGRGAHAHRARGSASAARRAPGRALNASGEGGLAMSTSELTRRELLRAGALTLGAVALAPRALFAAESSFLATAKTSPLVYVSPLTKDGAESRCHGEVWFFVDGNDVVIATSVKSWKARALALGRDRARLWVGDFGPYSGAREKVAAAPSVLARGAVDKDPATFSRLLGAYAAKYPDEWGKWKPRFESSYADGSRVVIRYQPQA